MCFLKEEGNVSIAHGIAYVACKNTVNTVICHSTESTFITHDLGPFTKLAQALRRNINHDWRQVCAHIFNFMWHAGCG